MTGINRIYLMNILTYILYTACVYSLQQFTEFCTFSCMQPSENDYLAMACACLYLCLCQFVYAPKARTNYIITANVIHVKSFFSAMIRYH